MTGPALNPPAGGVAAAIEDWSGVGFAVTVPASWFELDVRPATRNTCIEALVRERVAAQPQLWEHRGQITRLLREVARRGWEAGARYCAALVQPTEEGALTASVTVTVLGSPGGAGELEMDRVPGLLERLHTRAPQGPGESWTQVGVVELPEAGTAARAHGIEDVELPEGAGWVRVAMMQTYVPVPGTTTVLLVSCSSPVLALAEAWFDLFDAITGTFQLVDRTDVATTRWGGS